MACLRVSAWSLWTVGVALGARSPVDRDGTVLVFTMADLPRMLVANSGADPALRAPRRAVKNVISAPPDVNMLPTVDTGHDCFVHFLGTSNM